MSSRLESAQDRLLERIQASGGILVARLKKVLNALGIRVDTAQTHAIARQPGVVSFRPVGRERVPRGVGPGARRGCVVFLSERVAT
jgi:hypothetical protein